MPAIDAVAEFAGRAQGAAAETPGPTNRLRLWWTRLKQLAVALFILCLAAVGTLLLRHDVWPFAIFPLLPAATYALAYFFFVPDLLGGAVHIGGSFRRRWLTWLQWAGVMAMTAGVTAYGVQLRISRGSFFTNFQLAAVLLLAYLAGAVGVALWRYGALFLPTGEERPSGLAVRFPLAKFFKIIGLPARWLISILKPPRAIFSGSALVLVSVLLVTSLDYGCGSHSYRGYDLLAGNGSWLTAQNIDSHPVQFTVVRYSGWAFYAAGIAMAMIGLLVTVRLLSGYTVRRKFLRALALITAVVSVFTFTDLAFFWGTALDYAWWSIYWLLPLAADIYLHFRRARAPDRLPPSLFIPGVTVLLLPLLFLAFGTLMAFNIVFDVPGYAAFFVGILLLLWGYAQLSSSVLRRGLKHTVSVKWPDTAGDPLPHPGARREGATFVTRRELS